MEDFDIKSSLGYQVHISANIMRNNFNEFLKQYDIYTEQFGLLVILKETPNVTLSQIAQMIYKDKTTVTRLVDSLEKKALIKKAPSPTDRRAFLVSLTKEGENLVEKIGSCIFTAKKKLEDKFSDQEKEIFLKVLMELRECEIFEEIEQLKKEGKC